MKPNFRIETENEERGARRTGTAAAPSLSLVIGSYRERSNTGHEVAANSALWLNDLSIACTLPVPVSVQPLAAGRVSSSTGWG
jgi:hypothetical protein